MTHNLDETHDPGLRSWVDSANSPTTDFPIQNLPFAAFRLPGDRRSRIGTAIGDAVVDLRACLEAGCLDGLDVQLQQACLAPDLTPLMALGRTHWRALRTRLSQLLRQGSQERGAVVLAQTDQVELLLPAEIGDYTDFYASLHHATNVGRLFRPDNPLLPNYKHLPIGYHGRASSIVVSGTAVHRPNGQTRPAAEEAPRFGPTRMLDYEMEVGFFVGPGTVLGQTVPLHRAEEHIFGLCLVNDWSARDLQAWEYQPLGPFLAKSFATSVSPWVVSLDALAPFRCPGFERAADDPKPLSYLSKGLDNQRAGIDITVEVYLSSEKMRTAGLEPHRLSRGSFRDMYWSVAQMLTHHASSGCNLQPGDLMASGTVSGDEEGSQGSMLELTRRAEEPMELPSGETRGFLEDGDEVLLRAGCSGEGKARIGFGDCTGVVLPAAVARPVSAAAG